MLVAVVMAGEEVGSVWRFGGVDCQDVAVQRGAGIMKQTRNQALAKQYIYISIYIYCFSICMYTFIVVLGITSQLVRGAR